VVRGRSCGGRRLGVAIAICPRPGCDARLYVQLTDEGDHVIDGQAVDYICDAPPEGDGA
jgi:hypothetical protein